MTIIVSLLTASSDKYYLIIISDIGYVFTKYGFIIYATLQSESKHDNFKNDI